MYDEVETYGWDEDFYQKLLAIQKSGEYVGVGADHLGTIIGVEKKENQSGEPYIQVTYQVNL